MEETSVDPANHIDFLGAIGRNHSYNRKASAEVEADCLPGTSAPN
jgi:hypothetical protein